MVMFSEVVFAVEQQPAAIVRIGNPRGRPGKKGVERGPTGHLGRFLEELRRGLCA